MVDDMDEGSKNSDDLENVYDGIQKLESTTLDNVEGNHSPVHQYNRMTLRFSRKIKDNLAEEAKSLNNNSRESRSENQFATSTVETFYNFIRIVSLEKAVSLVRRIQIKVWATVIASGAMNLKKYKK